MDAKQQKGEQQQRPHQTRRTCCAGASWALLMVVASCCPAFSMPTTGIPIQRVRPCFTHVKEDVTERVGGLLGKMAGEVEGALRRKRLELCPWNDMAIQYEEAFAANQMWINPLQGWNQMQRAVDRAALETKGRAFITSPYWPVTFLMLAKEAIMEYGHRTSLAPPFGSSNDFDWRTSLGKAGGRIVDKKADCVRVNEGLVEAALTLASSNNWEEVTSGDDVQVWRTYLSPDMKIAGERLGKSAQFAAVKARGVINAPLDKVYDLFTDNTRVSEYNEYCKEVKDLEWLDESTKITYSTTGRPWCRDFVTRVHYRTLPDDTRLVVNRAEEHELAPRKKGFTRMGMSVGANLMRSLPGDSSKTEFTLLTHVNPGGMANTQFGAMVTNRLSTESPRQFLMSLGRVASASAGGSGGAAAAAGKGRRTPSSRSIGLIKKATTVCAAAAVFGGVMTLRGVMRGLRNENKRKGGNGDDIGSGVGEGTSGGLMPQGA